MKRLSTCVVALLCAISTVLADGPFRNHRYDSFRVLNVTSDNILFIGNSITDMHCWPEVFVTSNGDYLPIVNRGNSGTYSTEQSDNLESYINGKPKKVFMMIGTNDIATSGGLNFSPEQVLAYVKSIVTRIQARSPQTKIYLYSILKNNTSNRVEATWLKANELTKAYADATEGVTYIDLYDKLANVAGGGAWSYDNLHLTAGAYQAWASTICQYLAEGEDYTVSCVYPENTLTVQNAGGLGGSHGMRGTYFSCLPIKSNDILVFGDAFVKNGEWQEFLGNPNVKNRGTGWNNSGDIATTSKIVDATYATVEGVAKADAKAIFLYTGTADCTGSTDIETVKTNYKALVDKIAEKAPTSKIYLMAICPRNNASHNTRIAELNAYMESIATGNIRFVDTYSPFINEGTVNSKYVFSNDYIGGLAYIKIANLMKTALLADFPNDTYNVTSDADAEVRYAQAGLRNQLTQVIARGLVATRGDAAGQYNATAMATFDTKVAEASTLLEESITQDEVTAMANALNTILNGALSMPTYSTQGNDVWYQLFTPGRGNKYLTSTGAGASVTSSAANNYATSMWKFVNRNDSKGLDIINRHDGSYLAPTAAGNTPLTTSATQPTKGWTLSYCDTPGLFIVSSDGVQIHQTNGAEIWNWGGGSNRNDAGCQYQIEPVEGEPDEIPDPSVMTLTLTPTEFQKADGKSTWTYHGSTSSGGWYGKFVTGTTPALTCESTDATANNIGWSNNQPWLKAGYTYNLTLPEGFVIVGYELTTKSTSSSYSNTFTYTTAEGTGTSEAQSSTAKTVTASGLKTNVITLTPNGEATGSNYGILITNLVIKYKITKKTYTIDKSNGNLYKDNGTSANQSWNSAWRSNDEPLLVFGCGANNMNWDNNNVQMMTGQAGSATYTLTAPEGFVITDYSFTFANKEDNTNVTLTMDGTAYATSTTAKTISAEKQKLNSVSFVLSGTNGKGVVLTDFVVTIADPNYIVETEGYLLEIKESTGSFTTGSKVWSLTTDTNNPVALTFTSNANNMNVNGGYLQIHPGTAGTATYTIAVPSPYVITGYSFDYAFGNSGTGDKTITVGEQEYAVAAEKKTLSVTDLNTQSTGFTLSGSNQPVKLTNFFVTVVEPELPTEINYTLDKDNGNLYNGANANQNWNGVWKSNDGPQLQFGCGANNMNWVNKNIQLMTGTDKSSTYTITAPEGYVIADYSFTFANNNHDTDLSLSVNGDAIYGTSVNAQTVSAKSVLAPTVSFVLSGANNNGVVLTDFTVKVVKDVVAAPKVSTNEKQYWYYITNAASNDGTAYCAGKVIYYDSEIQKLRFGDRQFSADRIWSFWEQNGKLAIKNFNGEYFGTAPDGTGGSTSFGVVSEPNYIYNVNEAYGFYVIKDDKVELHAQSSNSVIVRWGAAAGNSSLWRFNELDVTNANTAISSTRVQQGKVTTGIGNKTQPILRATLRVAGLVGTANFQGVKGRFEGTDAKDVTNVKAYFTNNTQELFIDDEQKMTWRKQNGEKFGSTVQLAQDGTFNITGSKDMLPGDYYLWIAYDIAETAKEGNLVDAVITGYTVNGNEIAEVSGNPKHSVTVFLSEGTVLLPMDKGSRYYRIPALTATLDGRLVTLTDDRKQSISDLPNHCYLVAQYSDDNGKTWSDPKTVAGTADTGGDYGHGDASIVTDRNTGNIIGIMTSCAEYGHGFFAGTAEEPPLWKTIVSKDGGVTWSVPKNHTASLFGAACDNEKTKTWKSGFSGSGAALQKRDGTLVSSFVNRETDNSQNFYFFMSKDGGENWYVSGTSGTNAADEPKTLERNNGDLAISVRASGYNYYNVTSDNGQTWHNPSQTRFTTGISGNACDGEYMVWCSTVEGNEWDIAFQTIPNSSSRENVSIALSTDEGVTFGTPKTICPSGSAYSATVVLPDGTLGCYYEEDALMGGYTMRFVRFSLDWASNGEYKFTEENPFKPIKSIKPAAVTSSISEHKIGTFYANDPVNIPEGVKAYAATNEPNMEDCVIEMTEVEGIIPAHTGVVLRAEKGDYSFTQASTNGTVVNGNMLVGYAGPADYKEVALEDGYTSYVLTVMNEVAGFYKKEGAFKVYNHKAYLNVPKSEATALSLSFGDDDITGIDNATVVGGEASPAIYDLSGRRVEKARKGVYIINGKKVIF